MKVKDITSIMKPWQSLRIMEKDATQLTEPIFDNAFDICLPKEDEPVNEMEVVDIDASWNTIVLYVK